MRNIKLKLQFQHTTQALNLKKGKLSHCNYRLRFFIKIIVIGNKYMTYLFKGQKVVSWVQRKYRTYLSLNQSKIYGFPLKHCNNNH